MAGVKGPIMKLKNRALPLKRQSGFTLIEVLAAMLILTIGILSMIDVMMQGLKVSTTTQYDFIAKKKAEQAIEAIFTARNSQEKSWDEIQNVSNGGIFKDGPQPLYAPGPDGLVGTAKDDTAHPDVVITGAGPDGIMGTSDDVVMPLSFMTREIQITTVVDSSGNTVQNLRQITVIIRYGVVGGQKTQTFISYISPWA
jgi:prepilin-type N-terminal cleavage/methylation domain-containing protein